jgi:hypothetical protein
MKSLGEMCGWQREVVGGRYVAGEARCGGRLITFLLNFLHVSMMHRARNSRLVSALCLARPKRPLWSGDDLGAPDTVLGHAGWKRTLGRANGAG